MQEHNQLRSPLVEVEVSVVPFKFKHYQYLIDLHKSQKYASMDAIAYKRLPKIGFIAMLGDQPVAAGFLRRLEPCFAQLDTLVSSAHFGSQIRHIGVSKVVDSLINEAKRLELEGIMAITQDKSTLLRAEGLGFHVIDMAVIGMLLQKD